MNKKIKGHLHTLAGFNMFNVDQCGICTVISVNFMVKSQSVYLIMHHNASQLDSQMSLFFRWAHQKVRGWDPWNACLTGMPVCQTWSNRFEQLYPISGWTVLRRLRKKQRSFTSVWRPKCLGAIVDFMAAYWNVSCETSLCLSLFHSWISVTSCDVIQTLRL